MLFGYNGLEGLVEPFTKGVDNASTIKADGTGADESLVNLDCQVEVAKGIQAILLGVVSNVFRCRIRNAQHYAKNIFLSTRDLLMTDLPSGCRTKIRLPMPTTGLI